MSALLDLSGLFCLTSTEEDGELVLNYQGRIVRPVSPTSHIVQLYSWLDGGETKCVIIPNDTLTDEQLCRLYTTVEQWHEQADEIQRKQNQRKSC